MTNFTVSIKESQKEIESKIAEATKNHLNQKFPLAVYEINILVRQLLFEYLTKQDEFIALRNGDLKVELGLVDGQSRMLTIIDIWLGSIRTTFKPFTKRGNGIALSGGIKIKGISSDYSGVINDSEAIFITEKGETLPWLQWLLLEGSNVIIADYSFKPAIGFGRTRGGYMSKGGSWGISDAYAGDQNNNFVTRAIDEMQTELQTKIIQIIESKI